MHTVTTAEHAIVEDYWADLNREILGCLAMGPISPGEIGRRLGISEGAAASCLSLLVAEGRVRICLVEKRSSAA
jgi:predicted ArsR family transcriptional regulator